MQQELLFEAMLRLETADECRRFMTDLCTQAELSAMGQRYHVAVLLDRERVYHDIAQETSASTATISRVKRALRYGEDGYKLALEREKA